MTEILSAKSSRTMRPRRTIERREIRALRMVGTRRERFVAVNDGRGNPLTLGTPWSAPDVAASATPFVRGGACAVQNLAGESRRGSPEKGWIVLLVARRSFRSRCPGVERSEHPLVGALA